MATGTVARERMSEGVRGGGRQREVVRCVELVREGGEGELERVKHHLDLSLRENDDLRQKYIAASEKVSDKSTHT